MDADIRREIVALQKEIVQGFKSTKIPLGRRISLFFGKAFGKKEKSVSMSLPPTHSNFPIDCRAPLGSFVLFVVNTARIQFSICILRGVLFRKIDINYLGTEAACV